MVVRVDDSNEVGLEISIAAAVVLLAQGMVIVETSMGCGGGRISIVAFFCRNRQVQHDASDDLMRHHV